MTASPTPVRITAISGSIRNGSHCTAVLRSLDSLLPTQVKMEIFPLNDIPLYNADLEGDALPESVARMKASIAETDGLVLCSPEYNYGIPGVLKNAIDWASRPGFASPLKGKPVLVITASPGTAGGVRAQAQIRETLMATLARPLVRQHIAIPGVGAKLQEGRLADAPTLQVIQEGLDDLLREIRWLRNAHS